jgi:hypothetical protein
MWGTLSNKRAGLPFTMAAGPHQHSHSRAWVLQNSWPHFTVSDSRLPQPGGPGSHIYIPEKQGGPVIPPGTDFPFHCLLQFAGLQSRHKTQFLTVSLTAVVALPRNGLGVVTSLPNHQPHNGQWCSSFVITSYWYTTQLLQYNKAPASYSQVTMPKVLASLATESF